MTRTTASPMKSVMMLLLLLLLLLLVVVVVVVDGQEEEGGSSSNKLLTQLLEEHRSELSLYTSALQGIGLFKEFAKKNNGRNEQYTVFAPSDTAIRNDPHFFLYINGASQQPPTWHLHLRAAVLHHIVQGDQALTSDDLFSTSSNQTSMQKEVIHIDAAKQTLGPTGAKLSSTVRNVRAKNGVLHIVNQVFPVELTTRSLADLENQAEFRHSSSSSTTTPPVVAENATTTTTSLVDVVDFVGSRGRDALDITLTTGLTHVGCSRQALAEMDTNQQQQQQQQQTINDSPNGIRIGELLNATRKDETLQQFIEYSLLPECLYRTDLPHDFEQLVLPVNECAHIWVTKQPGGRVCFNAACQVDNPNYNNNTGGTPTNGNGGGNGDNGDGDSSSVVIVAPVGHDEPPFREFIARNGYGYVVDHCLLCPGLILSMDIGATHTSTPIQLASTLFQRVAAREGWNVRHVAQSVLQQAAREYGYPDNDSKVKSITILVPTERAWAEVDYKGSLSKFDEHFRSRLRDDDAWYLHLKHALFHSMIPNVHLMDDMRETTWEMSNQLNLTSLTGENIRVRYDDVREKLEIDGADVFLGDVKGIDGYMHFTESAPLPESLMNSLYTMARRDKQDRFRKQLNFVHHVGLLDYMQKIVPVTAFLVSNDKWPGPGEENEILPDIAANANVVDQVASNINALESEREILLNHIFILQGGPWSCSDLRNMDGQVVEASNGKNRVIVYDASNGKNRVIVYDEEQDAPCLAVQMQGGDAPPEILACVVECNILARNGIMHVIDRAIFHVEDPPTATPSGPQPTESPQPSSGPPTVSPAPTSPSTAPSIDASPGNATEPDGSDNSRAPSTSPAPSITAQPTITAAPSITAQPTITATPATTPTPTITAKPTASLSPNLDQATDGDSTISPAPTTTAQPTTTAVPTFTAAPTVTTSPSLAAPSSADGMELVFVTVTFNGIRIPVKGVPKLDEEDHEFFQTVTKDWYEMVYDEQVSSRPAGRRVTAATQQQKQPPRRRNLQEAGIYNFTTHVNYTDQAVSHPWNTITYNQVVSYYRPKERQQLVTDAEDQVMESTEQDSSWPPTPRDVLLSPFYDDLLVKNYTDRLRQNELFANITDSGNPFAPRSSADDDTDQSNSSIGGGGSRNYWNVYFILAYIGFGLAVASTFFLTVDLLLKLLLRPSLPPREEDEAARRPPSEAPLVQPSGTRIEFDKRPSDDRSLN